MLELRHVELIALSRASRKPNLRKPCWMALPGQPSRVFCCPRNILLRREDRCSNASWLFWGPCGVLRLVVAFLPGGLVIVPAAIVARSCSCPTSVGLAAIRAGRDWHWAALETPARWSTCTASGQPNIAMTSHRTPHCGGPLLGPCGVLRLVVAFLPGSW
ncbi:hypothetical protein Q31a_06730 [Aureliella helgolandensis]|uniref:Uncharacterized protein n=1 Tax=Aureliella helgolandensis TaxID=2527968 RepID=A0A518G1A6_9BACT|nr:hypothetical protein Q31a_06730 [Aureliella helgolandensis]